MTTRPSVAGVILAAGRATRFGATKQLVEVDGRPLVRHAVDVARDAGLSPILVVVGHDADAVRSVLPADVGIVDNPGYVEGQSTSLRAGVAAATSTDAGALVVLLADQPGLTAAAVRTVVAAHAAGALVARASYDDHPGHPVLFDREAWPAVAQVTGDRGARDLLADLHVVDVPVAGPRPQDVDTPEDLAP